MLYTDTSESWRLRNHRHRLAISVAGVATELALAGLATLAWALLDESMLRQSMLYLATTGWILSLALNASPFMRFDGYFILSDVINFPNLHERSGATAKAFMRRKLLGLNEPDPRGLPARGALEAAPVRLRHLAVPPDRLPRHRLCCLLLFLQSPGHFPAGRGAMVVRDQTHMD